MKYTAPLVDWIGYALNRGNLDKTLASIKGEKKIAHLPVNHQSNRRYLEKILREEVVKQFDNSFRPMLELVLNSLDAKPSEADTYHIRVYTAGKKFTVIDDGASLTLEQILRFLIVPFNTEKDGIEQIGRFGVGFLSNFFYCVNDRNTNIIVKTTAQGESYQLRFWCPTGKIEDLMLELKTRRRARNNNTEVIIRDIKYDSKVLVEYLTSNLSNIPSYMAEIYLDSKRINDTTKYPWFTVPVQLNIRDKKITQEIGLRGDSQGRIRITSQGIPVKTTTLPKQTGLNGMIGVVISFPSAVKLVEGRDEFKIDDNYKKCVEAAFLAFEKCITDLPEDHRKDKKISWLFSSLVSTLSVHGIEASIPNLNEIRKLMFGDVKYMMPHTTYVQIKEFLPEHLRNETCGVYHATYPLFHPFYLGYFELLNVLSKSLRTVELNVVSRYQKFSARTLPFIRLVLKKIATYPLMKVKLIRTEPGNKPFYFEKERKTLWINCRYPLCRSSFDPMKLYAFCCELSRELNLPYLDLEKTLCWCSGGLDHYSSEIMIHDFVKEFLNNASNKELQKCITSS